MIYFIDVPDSLLHQEGDILVLKVQMWDESPVVDLIFRLLLFFKRFSREHVEAVDLFHCALRLIHAHLVDLSAESLASRRDHIVEISRQQDLPIVRIT